MDFATMYPLVQLAFPGFTDRALEALSVARKQAADARHRYVTPEHLLLALAQIEAGPGRVALSGLGVDLLEETAHVASLIPAGPVATAEDRLSFSPAAERLLAEAKAGATELGHRYVGTEHFVLGMLRCGPCPAGDYLRQRGITVDGFRREVIRLLGG